MTNLYGDIIIITFLIILSIILSFYIFHLKNRIKELINDRVILNQEMLHTKKKYNHLALLIHINYKKNIQNNAVKKVLKHIIDTSRTTEDKVG